MIVRFLAAVLVVLVSGFTFAQTALPVNVPKLADITIDGDAADWGDRGMRYDVLTEAVPSRKPYVDHDATVRLAWTDAGLLVLADVIDASPVEGGDKALWEGDAVELFFLSAAKDATGFLQFVVAPGIDPTHPSLRVSVVDQRSPELKGKPTEQKLAAKKTEKGYAIEALLPWDSIGGKAAVGEQVRLQVHIDDRDAGRQGVSQLLVSPEKFARKRENTVLLQLAETPSDPVTTAASLALERWRRVRVNVASSRPDSAMKSTRGLNADVKLEVRGRLHVASGVITYNSPVDDAPFEVRFKSGPSLTLKLGNVEKMRAQAIADLPMVASPSVFDVPRFPAIDFKSPTEAEDLIGLYTLKTTFYDAEFNEVTAPIKPGRYGAIVQVTPDAGEPLTRFVTLYRTPAKLNWRSEAILGTTSLPPAYGVDPAVLQQRSRDVAAFTTIGLRALARQDDDLAAMLAGFSEMKPDSAAAVARTGPVAINQDWWHELQKRTGTLTPYKYVASLPKEYDQQPDKKWPLILFLHGSGERGIDLALVGVNGPARYFKTHDQPFVIVSPQCPMSQWWDPTRLHDLLDEVAAKYRVDPDRIYLTGLSMGGFGSWDLAMREPGRFAALAPVCGGGDEADVARIKDLPTWVFHGGRDDTVLPDESYRMVGALRDLRGRVRFTLYPEADHNSWTVTYNNPALYDWMLQQKRGQPDQPPATQPGTQPSE